MKKEIIDILRRLAFIPTILLFAILNIIMVILINTIGNAIYWICTGECVPDYYFDDFRDTALKYCVKILPNNEGDIIV